jgi:hypothetical protein
MIAQGPFNDGLCSRIESAYTASYTALSPLSHTCKRTKMSRTAPSAMQQLVSSLDLEPLEQDLFRGTSPQVGWQRVFGGQVIGQALVAAQRTVKSGQAGAFAACLFHAAGRSCRADHLHGRPDSRRLELCHKAGGRDPAWQGDLLPLGIVSEGRRRARISGSPCPR